MIATLENQRLECWRLLMFRRGAEEILLESDGARFALPQIEIPANERIAANINRAVERCFGLNVVSLYEVFPENSDPRLQVFYHAAVCTRPRQRVPKDMYWTTVSSLTTNSFSHQCDFDAVAKFQSGLNRSNGSAPEPFLQPNWFVEVGAWVEKSLRPHGLRLSGPFQQWNASPTFSLVRFETDSKPVWLKAVGEPNTREFHISLALARVCPQYLPRVLASNAGWNAWLAEEAHGTSLSSSADLKSWETVAESLARLQILALPHCAEISASGARDLRLDHLQSLVTTFCEFISMAAGSQDSEEAQHLDCGQLCMGIECALAELDRLQLPEALGHMDLNPRNIFCLGPDCVFLDWAEGFIGCPFFSFEYLLQHFRRSVSPDLAGEERFREAYLRHWRNFISHRDMERALAFAPLAALFAYATTLWSASGDQNVMTASQQTYLLRLARKMSRMVAREKGACA